MGELRYDPTRLPHLRARAAAALQHLLSARSTDPAAASALRVAALARGDLESQWLPALDRLLASEAMLAWTSSGPRPTSATGRDLGLALARQADALVLDATARNGRAMLDALHDAAADGEARRTFFAELGAARLLELLTLLATVDERTTELPDAVRAALVRTAGEGGLPGGFARQLVTAAADAHRAGGRNGDAALTLSYLLHGAQLPTGFLVEAAAALHAVEHDHARAEGLAGAGGWTLWVRERWSTASALRRDFGDPGRVDLPTVAAYDPMYALLGQLAADAVAARTVLTDRARAAYLFAARDVLADGGRAVVLAAAAAAAGPDVVPGAPRRLLDDASLVASGFVNHFGRAHASAVDVDDAVATAAATILGVHMYAVDVAQSPADLTDEERVATLSAEDRAELAAAGVVDRDGRLADPAIMAVGDLRHDALGDEPRSAAVFQAAPLDRVVEMAAGTAAGVATLRGALATYQRGIAAGAVARVAAGAVDDAGRFLGEVTLDAARLEGRVAERVGAAAARAGRDRDRTMTFWIDAAATGVEQVGGLFGGGAGSAVVDTVAAPLTGVLAHRLAGAERAAVHDTDRMARVSGERLAYVWYRELHDQGVLDTELPPRVAPGGRLPDHGDLVVRLLQWRHEDPTAGWTVERVLHELDASTGRFGVDLDGRSLSEALAAAQLPHHTPPG